MRRPMVLTIRHPPSAVPTVSAPAQVKIAQTGTESDWVVPLASSSTASTPTAFWASLAPWLKASHPEVTHCARSTGRFARAVTRRSQRRTPRSISQAAPKPSTGEIASATRTPTTPVGCPSLTPPQLTAPEARLHHRGAHQPPDQRVAGAGRQPPPPGHQVPDHRSGQGGTDHDHRLRRRHLDDAGDRVGHGRPQQQRTQQVADRGQDDRRSRTGASGRHQRRDGVGRVVEAVGERERQDGHNGQHERRVHPSAHPSLPRLARIIAPPPARPGRRADRRSRPGQSALRRAATAG